MALINPRDSDMTCWPPSVRHTFADFTAAEADAPRNGELYWIDGSPYWYNAGIWEPMSCCPTHTEIPDTAFVDPANPTSAEAETWIAANAPTATAGDLFYYGGTFPDSEYVWHIDPSLVVLRIESLSMTLQANLEIVNPDPESFVTYAGNSFTTCPGGTIIDYNWLLVHGGTTVADINGAPAADASGETEVESGTYETPSWSPDIFDGTCGDLVITLTATDDCGQTDSRTLTIEDFSVVALVFLNDGTGGDNGIFEITTNINSGTVTWDMGDGTIYENVVGVAHTYATPGAYEAIAYVCPRDLLGFSALQEEGLIGDFDSIFARTDISRFKTLATIRIIDNAQFHGELPSMIPAQALTDLLIRGTSITGSPPTLPATIDVVDLGQNLLDGTVPSLTGLTNLTYYDVADNELVGTFPSLDTNTALQIVDASNNNLEGALPDTTNNVALTRYLFSNNNFTGNIPNTFTVNNPNLQWVQIDNNQLDGALPDLTGLTNLTIFYANNNLLDGVVPVGQLTGLTALQRFRIQNNLLTGAYPTVATNTALIEYNLSNNLLTGALPSFVGLANLIDTVYGGNTSATYADGNYNGTNTSLDNVQAGGLGLTAGEVDNLICDVADSQTGSGIAGGTLNWSGNAARTVASDACFNQLNTATWVLIGA